MQFQTKTKKIGGSIGVILPHELIKEVALELDEDVIVELKRPGNLNFLWGIGKKDKTPTQKIMEDIDRGEYNGD